MQFISEQKIDIREHNILENKMDFNVFALLIV
jgi:hypothetical protein